MSFGISLERGGNVLEKFDGTFRNYRVVEVRDFEERAWPLTPDGTATSTSFRTSRVDFTHEHGGNVLVLRRYVSFRTTPYDSGAGGVYDTYYVTYRYLVCVLDTASSTGYGINIYDAEGNTVFCSNNKYVQFFSQETIAKEGTKTIPTTPIAGSYVYYLIHPVGDYRGWSAVGGQGGNTYYFIRSQQLDQMSNNVMRAYVSSTRSTFYSVTPKSSPMMFSSRAEADAAQGFNGQVPLCYATYKV